jgi:hypothetical protein
LSKEKEALTFAERIKMFSGGKDDLKNNRAIKYKNTLRDSASPLTSNKTKDQINQGVTQNEQNYIAQSNNEILEDNNTAVNEMGKNKEKIEKAYDSSEINNIRKEENQIIPQEINVEEDNNNKKEFIQEEQKYSQENHIDKIESNELSLYANSTKNYIREKNESLNSNETKNSIQVKKNYVQESHVDKVESNEISLSPIEKKEENLQTSELVNNDISKLQNESTDKIQSKLAPSKTIMEKNKKMINNI